MNRLYEEYPSSWDKFRFEQLTSFAKRFEYCKQHLEYMVSGSSRYAFKIDDKKVLKLAKNKKGLAQNKAEIDMFNDYNAPSICAPIFDHAEDGSWLEMAYAEKLTKLKFKKITGFEWEDFQNVIQENFKPEGYNRRYRFNEAIYDLDFYVDVFYMITNFGLDEIINDYIRLSTYGIIGNDIMIIDYGLSIDVWDDYYKR